MRILIHTRFYPSVGGIETVAELLAREWHRVGESVAVVSDVSRPREKRRSFPFPVYYRPGPVTWLKLLRGTDVFVHMNISLKAYWPLLIVCRPFVAVHHTYYYSDLGRMAPFRERLKLRLTSRAINIAISEFVARRIPAQCAVILNPVDLRLYRKDYSAPRSKELVFLGRLVSDKGTHLLLTALAQLRTDGIIANLTIIGAGPERLYLEKLVADLRLADQVVFVGRPPSEEVARLLHSHRILVVPSVAGESFGVVALEGAASGCFVLGSDNGGLPEAIGPTGSTFSCGNLADLKSKLVQLLRRGALIKPDANLVEQHLRKHEPEIVAHHYLEIFRNTQPQSADHNAS